MITLTMVKFRFDKRSMTSKLVHGCQTRLLVYFKFYYMINYRSFREKNNWIT